MKNMEVLSIEENAFLLFYNLEKTIECIHFTNAVNYCISISLEDPSNNDRHFTQEGFNNGKYDTEELLKDTYEKSEIFFNTYKERFTIEEDAVGYIEDMYNKFDFSGNFKYLSGFISYLKEKRLKK